MRPANKRRDHLPAPNRRVQGERSSFLKRNDDIVGGQVRPAAIVNILGGRYDPLPTRYKVVRQSPAPLVVDIYDTQPRRLAQSPVKEFLLRIEVRFHRVMVIEMVLRQVCKYRNAESEPVASVKIDGLRRGLHRGELAACIDRVTQKPVRVRSFRSCPDSLFALLPNSVFYCGEHRRLEPCRCGESKTKISGGGLA